MITHTQVKHSSDTRLVSKTNGVKYIIEANKRTFCCFSCHRDSEKKWKEDSFKEKKEKKLRVVEQLQVIYAVSRTVMSCTAYR